MYFLVKVGASVDTSFCVSPKIKPDDETKSFLRSLVDRARFPESRILISIQIIFDLFSLKWVLNGKLLISSVFIRKVSVSWILDLFSIFRPTFSVWFLCSWMGLEKSFPTIYYKPKMDLRIESYGQNTKLGPKRSLGCHVSVQVRIGSYSIRILRICTV